MLVVIIYFQWKNDFFNFFTPLHSLFVTTSCSTRPNIGFFATSPSQSEKHNRVVSFPWIIVMHCLPWEAFMNSKNIRTNGFLFMKNYWKEHFVEVEMNDQDLHWNFGTCPKISVKILIIHFNRRRKSGASLCCRSIKWLGKLLSWCQWACQSRELLHPMHSLSHCKTLSFHGCSSVSIHVSKKLLWLMYRILQFEHFVSRWKQVIRSRTRCQNVSVHSNALHATGKSSHWSMHSKSDCPVLHDGKRYKPVG